MTLCGTASFAHRQMVKHAFAQQLAFIDILKRFKLGKEFT
jgi:hypothetical protein